MLYAQLVRLDRPIGIYLLLWPTLWALAIAGDGGPDLWVLFVFVVGVVLMRSAGCAINDYADRDIDLHVARTKDRPLTSGKVTPRETLAIFALLALMAFALVLTLGFTNAAFAAEAGLEARFSRLALDCVHREYPNKIAHVLNSAADVGKVMGGNFFRVWQAVTGETVEP